MKKRVFSLLISLVLLVSLTASSLAENPLDRVFSAAEDLFFSTSNVTLTGEAVLSLDGVRFKTVNALYRQDLDRSLWQLDLSTPKRDGTERPGGYTVIANGEYVYVMEVYTPGFYKSGTSRAQSTILRNSVEMNLMKELARSLAAQADTLLPEGAVSAKQEDTAGQEVSLHLAGDVPPVLNAALNLFFQYAARRYFHMDYDLIDSQSGLRMSDFITVTQGIFWTARSLSLLSADVQLNLDADGSLSRVSGAASVSLETQEDGARQLDISFSLQVSDRGETRVESFDPEAFDVRLAEGAVNYDSLDQDGMPLGEESPDQDGLSLEAFQAKWDLYTDNLNAWYLEKVEQEGPFCFWPVEEQFRFRAIVDDISDNDFLRHYYSFPGFIDETCVCYDISQWTYELPEYVAVSQEDAVRKARELLKSAYGYGDETDAWTAGASLISAHWSNEFSSPWWAVSFYDGAECKTTVWINAVEGEAPLHDTAVPVEKAKAAFLESAGNKEEAEFRETLLLGDNVSAYYLDTEKTWHVFINHGNTSFWEITVSDETLDVSSAQPSNG